MLVVLFDPRYPPFTHAITRKKYGSSKAWLTYNPPFLRPLRIKHREFTANSRLVAADTTVWQNRFSSQGGTDAHTHATGW
jgi:hypothetical protein